MSNKGTLFVVATPIGNLDDITQRAKDTLTQVDLIAAEDTRHSKKLLNHFGIKTPMVSLHAHNEQARAMELIAQLKEGKQISLISDAGTPLISDPGCLITHLAHEAGITVVPIPGVSAVITALSVAGLPAERFVFEGFLPVKSGTRVHRLEELKSETRTWVVYESPHRIMGLLEDMITVLGDSRPIVIARELTKQFETLRAGAVSDIKAWMEADLNQQKGEFVVVVKGEKREEAIDLDPESERVLRILLDDLPLKQAVKLAASITEAHKNTLYQRALEMRGRGK